MAKRKPDKRGRSGGSLGSFVALERYLLNCKAWLDLTALARSCYIELAAAYTGRNNGHIAYSSRNLGQRLGVGKATACRGLSELEAHGFIEVAKHASFQSKMRLATEYRLTAFKCDKTGNVPSKSFMQWQPKIQNTVSPAIPYGSTHETVTAKVGRKGASRFHQRNREGVKSAPHGFTHEPLLYSSHTPAPQTQSFKAQRGPAHREAGADASLHCNQSGDDPATFVFITGQPLTSLEQLSDELPTDFQSWQPRPAFNPGEALAKLAETIRVKASGPLTSSIGSPEISMV